MDLNISIGFVKSRVRLPQTGDNLEGIYGTAIFGTANPDAPSPFGFAPPDQNFAHLVWRETDRFINSGRLNWRPKDYITAHATVGLDYTGYSDESFNAPGQGCAICGQQRQGLRAIDSFRQYKYSVDLGSSHELRHHRPDRFEDVGWRPVQRGPARGHAQLGLRIPSGRPVHRRGGDEELGRAHDRDQDGGHLPRATVELGRPDLRDRRHARRSEQRLR